LGGHHANSISRTRNAALNVFTSLRHFDSTTESPSAGFVASPHRDRTPADNPVEAPPAIEPRALAPPPRAIPTPVPYERSSQSIHRAPAPALPQPSRAPAHTHRCHAESRSIPRAPVRDTPRSPYSDGSQTVVRALAYSGSFFPGFRSPDRIASTPCVTNCLYSGTSLRGETTDALLLLFYGEAELTSLPHPQSAFPAEPSPPSPERTSPDPY
jgi:hypothetical protein